ncbi:MAG: hypothetical protein WCC53_05725 [Thermoanaerobaculia bacterium]|jgi:hypothetical protein
MTFTNFTFLPAQLSVLAFLGAGALTAALLASAAIAALARRAALARTLGLGGAALPASYVLVLLAAGAATPARTVPRGAEKFFCEADCHVGYSVVDVREALGSGGRRVIVTLRSHFDEKTTAPWRGNGPLTPNPRSAALVDALGRRFAAEPAGVRALEPPLRPGESYATDLVFHVPAGAESLRLSLVESEAFFRLLLGHERAPFAGETSLALR